MQSDIGDARYKSTVRSCAEQCEPQDDYKNCTKDLYITRGCVRRMCCQDEDLCNTAHSKPASLWWLAAVVTPAIAVWLSATLVESWGLLEPSVVQGSAVMNSSFNSVSEIRVSSNSELTEVNPSRNTKNESGDFYLDFQIENTNMLERPWIENKQSEMFTASSSFFKRRRIYFFSGNFIERVYFRKASAPVCKVS